MSIGESGEKSTFILKHRSYTDDVFDVNTNLKDLEYKKDIDYILVNRMIGKYLMAILFTFQAFAKDLKDAYVYKSWMEYYMKQIDKGKDLNLELIEDLGAFANLDKLEDYKYSIEPILKRLKTIYKDIFLNYAIFLNDRAFEVLEAVYEGLLDIDDLEEIFDNRLDIPLNVMNRLKEVKSIESEILEDIYINEKFIEITFNDLLSEIEETNKILIESDTPMIIKFCIYSKEGNTIKRQRFNGSVKKDDKISDYIISYMLVDERDIREKKVKKKFYICNYKDYLSFKKEMKSIRSLMLGGR